MRHRVGALAALALTLTLTAGAEHAVAGNGRAALSLIPADSAIVVSVDVERARSSPLFGLGLRVLGRSDGYKRIKEPLETRAGLRLDRDVSTFVAAFPADFERTEAFVLVVEASFDRQRFLAFAKEDAGDGWATRKHAGTTYYEIGGSGELALVGDHIVVTSKGRMKAVLDAKRSAKKRVLGNRTMKALIDRTDTKKDAWVVAKLPPDVRAQMAQQTPGGQGVEAVTLSVDARKGLVGRLRVATGAPASAEELSRALEAALQQQVTDPAVAKLGIGRLLAKLSVSHDAGDVVVAFDYGPADLLAMKQLRGLLGI